MPAPPQAVVEGLELKQGVPEESNEVAYIQRSKRIVRTPEDVTANAREKPVNQQPANQCLQGANMLTTHIELFLVNFPVSSSRLSRGRIAVEVESWQRHEHVVKSR